MPVDAEPKSFSVRRLGKDTVFAGVSTLAIGVISFSTLAVAARGLSDDQAAEFVSLWAMVNTLVFTVTLPIEHLAPRLIANRSSGLSVLGHSVFLAIVSGIIGLGLVGILDGFSVVHVAALGLVAGLGMWCGSRAVFVGHGEFGRMAAASVVYLCIALVGCSLLLWSGAATVGSLIMTIAGSSLVSGALLGLSKRRLFSSSGQGLRLPRGEYALIGSSIAATLVTLIQNNGPLALGSSSGIDSEDLVIYAGVITLVRVPFMLLNNVMAPLNLRFVELSDKGETRELHRVALLVLSAMLASIFVVMLTMIRFGRFGFHILIGGQYEFDVRLALGATLAEGVIWLTLVPRLLGSARGAGSVLFGAWAIGLIAFAVAWTLGPAGAARLVVAPTVSAAMVLVVSMPLLLIVEGPWVRLRRLGPGPRR